MISRYLQVRDSAGVKYQHQILKNYVKVLKAQSRCLTVIFASGSGNFNNREA